MTALLHISPWSEANVAAGGAPCRPPIAAKAARGARAARGVGTRMRPKGRHRAAAHSQQMPNASCNGGKAMARGREATETIGFG